MSSRMRFWIAAAIIAAIIVGGFAISVPHTQDVPHELAPALVPAQAAPTVTLRDSYKKGVHTITGAVTAPNPCTTLSANTALEGEASTTRRIVVAIALLSDAGICLERPTKLEYAATVEAPADLPIVVTVDGAEATTTAP